jgi:glutathione S-transferase
MVNKQPWVTSHQRVVTWSNRLKVHFVLSLCHNILSLLILSDVANAWSLPPLPSLPDGLSKLLPLSTTSTSTTATTIKTKGTLERLGITPDDPQRFRVAPEQIKDIGSAALTSLLRFGSGAFAEGYRVSLVPNDDPSSLVDGKPAYSVLSIGPYRVKETSTLPSLSPEYTPIEIYEFEGCPFCKKVREAVTILCLEACFKPCPMNGPTFRNEIKTTYGKNATFPFMRDPNTGVEMFQSDDIITYLFRTYGTDGTVPSVLRPSGGFTTLSVGLSLIPRLGAGSSYKLSKKPSKPLILWAYEASPFCKVVKECLCEMELPYIQISCPRGSSSRQRLFDQTGRFQAPYLVDPNTEDNVALFESRTIIEYLKKQYGIPQPSVNYI